MDSPGQRQWKQWPQLCTAPRQAGAAAVSLLYVACDPLAPLPPGWGGKTQVYETPRSLDSYPPATPLPSELPPAVAGLENSSPGRPRAGSPPVDDVRGQRDHWSVPRLSPFLHLSVVLTSREALARSCSVGHFYSPKAGKKR